MADVPRILVIDDAALMRLYYRHALEAAGFEVHEALNGLEALEKVMMSAFDLLIVDVNMPQMDGLTFLKTLRARDDDAAATPAVVASTEAAPQDLAAAQAAGANLYLVKPLRPETLVAHVRLMCGAAA